MTTRAPKTEAAVALFLCLIFADAALSQGLSGLYRITDGVSSSHVEYHVLKIPQGKDALLADLQGPGKVTYFYITDNSHGKFYRGLVLKALWDDEKEPSIQVPLADFFGAIGSRTIDYQSAPMQINHYCYMCYLPMPFSRQARFILANDGDQDYVQKVAYGIDYERGEQFAGEKSRLHCQWQRSNPTQNAMHPILEAQGRGHYVGNFLQVHSRYGGWWGEGDTIFHIDGQPITHTPGTEDEYGSCWEFGHTYSYLDSGYLLMEKEDHRMYRWYLANPVRFQQSLTVEIQDQRNEHGQIPSQDDFTSVAFWYQEEPHRGFKLQPFADRVAPSRAAEYGK
jgi:hypothetical protein